MVFEGGFDLSEVRKWDMEDVDRFNDFFLMKQDYAAAHSAFVRQETKTA